MTTPPGQPDPNQPDPNQPDQTGQFQPTTPVSQGFPQPGTPPFDPAAAGPPSGQFAAPPSGQFAAPPSGQFPQPGPYWGPPAPPSAIKRLGLPNVCALLAAVAGIITFFMGFVSWVTIDESLEHKAENWADDQGSKLGIPGFFSVNMVLNPGYFFLLLGACAVAAALVVVPAYRRFLPLVAVFTALGYLGLFASAVVLPSFISLGAGAIVALIFGALQLALTLAGAVIAGLRTGA